MTVDELNGCATLLGDGGMNFAKLATANRDALQAGMACVNAQSYLVELAAHLQAGMEPFDANEAAARGALALPESAAAVLRMLSAKPTK